MRKSTMKSTRRLLMTIAFGLAVGLAFGCDDKGPLEQAAEEIDEAIEDAKAGEETLGNRLDDSIDELREGAKDARKKLQGD